MPFESRRRTSLVLLVSVNVLHASIALAQANYQPFPLGERAVGLGGAFTGLADDESGSFYNPAGPAFAKGDSLSLTANFYGIVMGTFTGGFGGSGDFSYGTINLVPATSSSLFHIGPASDDELSPWVLCINVYAPGNFNLDNRQTIVQGPKSFTMRRTQRDRQLFAGPTIARRMSARWSLGVSLFGSIHLSELEGSNVLGSTDPPIVTEVTYAESSTNVGLMGSAGIRFLPTDRISLGFSVRSPVVHLYSEGTRYLLDVNMAPPATAEFKQTTSPHRTRFELPTKFSLGIGWVKARSWGWSADFNVHLPHEFKPVEKRDVTRRLLLTPNFAFGGERYFGDSFVVRAGMYTDLPNVAHPNPGQDTGEPDQLYTIGATLTGSSLTKTTSTTFGVVATYSVVFARAYLMQSNDYSVGTGDQIRIYFVISSSFSY